MLTSAGCMNLESGHSIHPVACSDTSGFHTVDTGRFYILLFSFTCYCHVSVVARAEFEQLGQSPCNKETEPRFFCCSQHGEFELPTALHDCIMRIVTHTCMMHRADKGNLLV